jgi:CheY-like chemotaxis protein
MKSTGKATQEALRQYLQEKRVLVVDTQPVARSVLFKLMRDLGSPPQQLILASGYDAAEAHIREQKPHVVLAEYELGSRSGLDLLREQREAAPEATRQSLFILVTGNTSQSAVARALEEEVDAFILKPFTPSVVRNTIMNASLLKVSPPAYQLKIDAAKAEIAGGRLDEAVKLLEEARTLGPQPALACYYLAQIEQFRRLLDRAEGRYEEGLRFNHIHYKCMVGLYELQMQQGRHEEAYRIVQRISRYFPANPKRLAEVIRLAVLTGKFADIEQYYRVFTSLDLRNPELVRYTVAGLVVCAKHYLSTGTAHARAIELFERAVVNTDNRTRLLATSVIPTLLDFGLVGEAESFLTRFPPEDCFSDEFMASRFLIIAARGIDNVAFAQGRALLMKGYEDHRFFQKMLEIAVRNEMELLEHELLDRACQAFPSARADFEKTLADARKKRAAS